MPTGYLTITSYPENAIIYIDNVLITDEQGIPVSTPSTLILEEGTHNIMLELKGYCNEYDVAYIFPGRNTRIHKIFYIC